MGKKPDYVLDFRESLTLMGLVKMSSLVGQMRPRELIEIIVAEHGPRSDVLAMVPECDLIRMDVESGFCRLLLEIRDDRAAEPPPGSSTVR
jgi:hypothetical protein